jgi:hypothetical protein
VASWEAMRPHEAKLRTYISTYRDAVDGLSYHTVPELQPPPFASLAFGGAGTAYVLLRLGASRRAARWLQASLADRRHDAFAIGDTVPATLSYLHGRGGLLWLYCMTAAASRRPRSLTAYRHAVTRVEPIEFIEGTAGHLTGIRLLLRKREDTALRALGDTLAARLSRRVRARVRRPWQAIDAIGFAHFWPGVLHALLAWQAFCARPVPRWLDDAMRSLLAVWVPKITRTPELAASWCNGAAGTVLMWSKAFEVTGDLAYRTAAARAADQAARASHSITSDLCCGVGGVAYSFLELARVDPSGSWRERATELAARAIDAPAMRWPNGLFRGHPGLVCLALDLLADVPEGFPTIEA